MAAVTDLLLQTLEDLSDQDLKEFMWFLQFTCFQKSLPQFPPSRNRKHIVNAMVQTCGHQSVEVTIDVFRDMKRTDLVQRLSESSSGLKEKLFVDEHWAVLSQKVETLASVIELILETLAGLSYWEFEVFKEVLCKIHYKHYSDIPRIIYMRTDLQDTVFFMVQTYGEQSVEKTMEGLNEMKRTDLAQRLSDCSPEPKKKHSVDERRSALIHKVAMVAAVKQLLLEALNDLRDSELEEFKRFLKSIFLWMSLSYKSQKLSQSSNRADVVNLMMDKLGQQSVEVTREVFMYMNRTDLVQKLSESSSASREKHSVDEHGAALLKRKEAMEAGKQLLFETLNDLSQKDFKKFSLLLKFTCFMMGLPQLKTLYTETTHNLVYLMINTFGQQSLEVTKEVLMDMNRSDLVQKLSDISFGFKVSSEKIQPSFFQTDAFVTSAIKKLLDTLEDLSFSELEHFKRVLQQRVTISASQLETADGADVVKLMVQTCGDESVEVTMEVLTDMNRTDLVLRLSEGSSPSKGKEAEISLELKRCGTIMQDSSDWTKLEPEVNSTDADEAPTYSLQSAAGHFECRVSGLRWVCKGKTSFQYQFRSWEGHMERMESRQYMPAGPLMDVTVTAGKLNEVHLPHWICIDDIPDILDMFAVVHIDDCGDVVEKVSEVTPTHVKLTEPIFSPRAVLMKVGVPVKINCNVLIYQTNTAFLTLHVYLIPRDPGLQQTMDRREVSCGYKVIRKPHPEKSLKMFHRFILRADLDGVKAQI
ncbi:beta-galactoside alpha-2,6-sialyltransferase (sialyltransferase 2) [Sarotherodon galilaeus]